MFLPCKPWSEAMDWFEIGALDEIPRRGARCVTTPQGRIGIFRTADDRVYAIEDRCPHRGGPLSQGMVHGASVSCPLHNWVFSLETGQAQGADEGAVKTLPVRLVEGRISLGLDAP
jgi:nitrite reductase (NADH) small subunit